MIKLSKAVSMDLVVPVETDNLAAFICENDWCPAQFHVPKRNLKNFKSIDVLALDFDGGLTLTEAKERFAGFKCIIAPTRNHQVSKNGVISDRFRVVLTLSYPISDAKQYTATWKTAAEIWPEVDQACKDASRLFFKSTFVYEEMDGEPFPVTEIAQSVTVSRVLPTLPAKIVPKQVKEFAQNGAAPGGWNNKLFQMAKLMQEAGHDLDDTLEFFSTMNNPHFSGTLDDSDVKTIESAFSMPGKYPAKLDFPVMYMTKDGVAIAAPRDQENFKYLITEGMGQKVRYNQLRNVIEVNGVELNDFILSNIRMTARGFKLNPTQELLEDVIRHLAVENSYHPFKEAVETMPWDGVDHIHELFGTLTIEGEPLPIYETYLRRWLIAMVGKVYRPGVQNNVLVLKGRQGARKSRWLERFGIVKGAYNESSVNPTDKDDKIKACSTVIWVLSELDAITRKRDVADLKAFTTDNYFSVRAPYDRYAKEYVAVASFAASVNEDSFLQDKTGNRRFLVIPISSTNPLHTINMQQVFAQAKTLFDAGERYWFEADEIATVNEINEDYVSENRIEFLVADVKPGTEEMMGDEILTLVGYKDARGPADYSQLGHALNRLGIIRVRREKNKVKRTFYLVDRSSLPNKLKVV